MRLRIAGIVLATVSLTTLCGCGKGLDDSGQSNTPTVSTEQVSYLGDVFLESNLKIQSTITDTSVDPSRSCTVELYVDGDGDGQGLLGFGDQVLDVRVVNDMLYIIVDQTTVVGVTNITGRLVFSDTTLAGYDDLATVGFTLDAAGTPIQYAARQGTTNVSTRYAQSVNSFDTASVTATTTMGFNEAIVYIMDYLSEQQVSVESPEENPEVKDFYIGSEYGVAIDGTVFSIGDTCNPSTYFNGLTPEGLVDSFTYRQDERVDFTNASYISNTGRTVFTLMGNYVQAIQTTADFSFLGIEKGMSANDLKYALGYKLTTKQMETWEPIDPDLVVTGNKSQDYYCTVGNLYVEFRCTKNVLTEIYIEQTLDFKR